MEDTTTPTSAITAKKEIGTSNYLLSSPANHLSKIKMARKKRKKKRALSRFRNMTRASSARSSAKLWENN